MFHTKKERDCLTKRAREYLMGLMRESENIDYRLRVLDDLRFRLNGYDSTLKTDGVSGSKIGADRIGTYTARIVDLERELDVATEAYRKKRNNVMLAMIKMEDARNVDLIMIRYFEGEPWRNVAAALGVSETWVYTLHNRALKQFDNVFFGYTTQ